MTNKQKRQLITQTSTAIKRGHVSLISLRRYATHIAFAPGHTYSGGRVAVQREVPTSAYIP